MSTTRRRTNRDEEAVETEDQKTAASEIEKAISGKPAPAVEQAGVFDFNELMDAIHEEVEDAVTEIVVKALGPILASNKAISKSLSTVMEQVEEAREQNTELLKAINSANEGSELLKSIINGKREEAAATTPEAAAQNADKGVQQLEKAILNKEVNLTEPEAKPGELTAAQKTNLGTLVKKATSLRTDLEKNIPGLPEVYACAQAGQPVSAAVYELLEKSVKTAEEELNTLSRR